MKTYPIHLDIQGRRCLVVGGGPVAARKVEGLLAAGARVALVSPRLHPPLEALAATGGIDWTGRQYRDGDLDDAFLVIAATDQATVNRQIAAEAGRRGVLCNVVDRPDAGSFSLPSVVRRGDLVLTVSTSGQSPALAKHLRKEIEARFGIEYENLLRLLGAVRRRLLDAGHDPEGHRETFIRLVEADLAAAIRNGRWSAVRQRLTEILGETCDDALLNAAGVPDDGPARPGNS